MSVSITVIVACVLSAGGGFAGGFLARQNEINRLHKQIECLQDELKKSQKLSKQFSKDLELLRLQIQIKENENLIELLNESQNRGKGELLYAYGLYEYLDLKLQYIFNEHELTEEEAHFVDTFAKMLNNNLPDGIEGKNLKKSLKSYLICRFQDRVENDETPNLNVLICQIQAALEGGEAEKEDLNPPTLKCLALNEEQYRAMYSLERLKIIYDINTTKNEVHQRLKQEWFVVWSSKLLESIGVQNQDDYFYENEAYFYNQIAELYEKSDSTNWYYVMAMEAALFVPYFSFNEEDEKAKIWKKIKLSKDYLQEVFVKSQSVIDEKYLHDIRRCYQKAVSTLNKDYIPKIILPFGITALIAVATGGLGAFFAPEIAVSLVGTQFAGLYGQALVNASLAYLGGGALAAGGAGMAGGTVLVTGGASILGLAGGSAAGSLTSALIDTSPELILRECAKLITSCTIILLQKNKETNMVEHLCGQIEKKKKAIDHQVTILKLQQKDTDKEKRKNLDNTIKTMKDSYDYLNQTGRILRKRKEKTEKEEFKKTD